MLITLISLTVMMKKNDYFYKITLNFIYFHLFSCFLCFFCKFENFGDIITFNFGFWV